MFARRVMAAVEANLFTGQSFYEKKKYINVVVMPSVAAVAIEAAYGRNVSSADPGRSYSSNDGDVYGNGLL